MNGSMLHADMGSDVGGPSPRVRTTSPAELNDGEPDKPGAIIPCVKLFDPAGWAITLTEMSTSSIRRPTLIVILSHELPLFRHSAWPGYTYESYLCRGDDSDSHLRARIASIFTTIDAKDD